MRRTSRRSRRATKQDISKRLAEPMREGERVMAFVDACVRQRYGNRSEKLVELGLQPFRPQPRIRLVGPDGERVKRGSQEGRAAGAAGEPVVLAIAGSLGGVATSYAPFSCPLASLTRVRLHSTADSVDLTVERLSLTVAASA